jgi:hypothetical protein
MPRQQRFFTSTFSSQFRKILPLRLGRLSLL